MVPGRRTESLTARGSGSNWLSPGRCPRAPRASWRSRRPHSPPWRLSPPVARKTPVGQPVIRTTSAVAIFPPPWAGAQRCPESRSHGDECCSETMDDAPATIAYSPSNGRVAIDVAIGRSGGPDHVGRGEPDGRSSGESGRTRGGWSPPVHGCVSPRNRAGAWSQQGRRHTCQHTTRLRQRRRSSTQR